MQNLILHSSFIIHHSPHFHSISRRQNKMARSLFARLHNRYGPRIDGATRRDFLKASLLASAGLLLSRHPLFADVPAPRKNGIRVAVIGAGFSGLACAYELMSAGYDVTVIEARDRVGGRVISFNDLVP